MIVDRVELEVLQHQRGDGRQAGLGIPHGRRRQARDRAEVALLIDQHVAHVPFLGHAHQGGIDDAFAVGMVVAAGVAGDFGALHPAGPRREVQVVHGDQDAPLRGLQAVAHVGQRPADDHAHGVRQVALLQLVFDGLLDDPAGHVGQGVGGGFLGREIIRVGSFRRQIRVGSQGRFPATGVKTRIITFRPPADNACGQKNGVLSSLTIGCSAAAPGAPGRGRRAPDKKASCPGGGHAGKGLTQRRKAARKASAVPRLCQPCKPLRGRNNTPDTAVARGQTFPQLRIEHAGSRPPVAPTNRAPPSSP